MRVLLCLSRTLSNAACYQDVLDHTRPDEQPAYSTEWPIEGDARISRLNELARAEIDNTYELLRLMDGEPGAFFPIVADDAHEDAFLLSAQLPRQLCRKHRSCWRTCAMWIRSTRARINKKINSPVAMRGARGDYNEKTMPPGRYLRAFGR